MSARPTHLGKRDLQRRHAGVLDDSLVNDSLHFKQLARCQRIVIEVEGEFVWSHIGSFLARVLAHDLVQRPVEKMSGRVMTLDRAAPPGVNRQAHGFAQFGKTAGNQPAAVYVNATLFLGVSDRQTANLRPVGAGNVHQPRVAYLTTHLGVAGGAVDDQGPGVARFFRRHGFDHGLGLEKIVAEKRRRIDLKIFLGDSDDLLFLSPARPGALLFHQLLKTLDIDGHAAFPRQQLCEVKGKAVGVIQLKSNLTADLPSGRHDFAGRRTLSSGESRVVKFFESSSQGPVEGLLFSPEHVFDLFLPAADLRKDIAHRSPEGFHELAEEGFAKPESAPVTNGSAQNPAKDIVTVGIARLNAIGDCKAQGPDMIADNAKGKIGRLLRSGARIVAKIGQRASISLAAQPLDLGKGDGKCLSRSWKLSRAGNR